LGLKKGRRDEREREGDFAKGAGAEVGRRENRGQTERKSER
jgi:hypothetical protein